MARAKAVRVVGRAAAFGVAAISGTSAIAADWTGGGTVQNGTYSTGLTSATAVSYLLWSDQAGDNANWNGTTYVIGDLANFNAASGTFNVVPTTGALNPSDINFTGGATYNFIRASSSSASNANATFAQTGSLGVDSFGATTPWNASASATMDLTLDANFAGTVILGNRAAAITTGYTGTTTISGGTLEVRDAAALPAAVQNNPSLTLNGGTFAVNIDGLNNAAYTFQQGNRNPGTAQHGGTITVTANSNLSNTATDWVGRARDQSNLWNGSINVASGTTLTVNTGGGASLGNNVSGAALSGAGTIRIGANAASSVGSNRLRLSGNLATGSATLNFDLGTTGSLQNAVALNGTTNLGSLSGGANTLLTGTSNAVSTTVSASTISVGANGASTTFSGVITNGVSTTSSSGTPVTAGVRPEAKSVANTNLTKTGAGSLTLAGANLHGGITTVSGGTLIADNIHALGDSSGAVTVNAASTLDFNGKSQVAGKSYVLAGGSLLNNGGLAVTINNGASGNFTTNGSAQTASSGVWTSGTPTVAFSAPGGSGTTATGEVLLQLGWLRGNSDGATVGSGYLKEPRIIFSDPDGITIANGGRPIKATAFLTNTAGGTSVAGVTIIDPGYGYASVPTVTIDNTGTGGSGFNPVFTMTASGVRITNAGSGYTSAPTVTFGGAGYAGFATGQGGFGSISVNSTSNIGGSGDLVVDAVASGAGGLNKVGAGTVFLNAVNTYAGLTDVQAGTLGGTGSIAGNLQVGASGKIAPGASIESFGVGGNADLGAGALLIEYDGSGAGSIDLLDVVGSLGIGGATVNFSQLGAAANDPAYVFASYGSLPVEPFASVLNLPSGYQINYHYNDGNDSNNIALVAVPEPTSAGALAAIGLLITARRRRRRID